MEKVKALKSASEAVVGHIVVGERIVSMLRSSEHPKRRIMPLTEIPVGDGFISLEKIYAKPF